LLGISNILLKTRKCSQNPYQNVEQVADLTTKERSVKKECDSVKKELAETRDLLAAQVAMNAELEAQQMNKKRKIRSSLPSP
jgi:hypothetical protein